jgi:hypothetical protein
MQINPTPNLFLKRPLKVELNFESIRHFEKKIERVTLILKYSQQLSKQNRKTERKQNIT